MSILTNTRLENNAGGRYDFNEIVTTEEEAQKYVDAIMYINPNFNGNMEDGTIYLNFGYEANAEKNAEGKFVITWFGEI